MSTNRTSANHVPTTLRELADAARSSRIYVMLVEPSADLSGPREEILEIMAKVFEMKEFAVGPKTPHLYRFLGASLDDLDYYSTTLVYIAANASEVPGLENVRSIDVPKGADIPFVKVTWGHSLLGCCPGTEEIQAACGRLESNLRRKFPDDESDRSFLRFDVVIPPDAPLLNQSVDRWRREAEEWGDEHGWPRSHIEYQYSTPCNVGLAPRAIGWVGHRA